MAEKQKDKRRNSIVNCPTKRCLPKLEDRGNMFYCPTHNCLLEGEDVIIVKLEIAEENKGFRCTDCEHLKKDNISCKAFPESIPEPFLQGIERHTEPKYQQKNKIVFKKKVKK